MPLLHQAEFSDADVIRSEIQKIIDAAKTIPEPSHNTLNFLNVDGKVNEQRCEHMLDVETEDFLDKYSAAFDDVKDDDVYDSSIDAAEKNKQLQMKKTWCNEFLLGFIRLH